MNNTPPLLTYEQVVDWLIYHVPLYESYVDNKPFTCDWYSMEYQCRITVFGSSPWEAYEEMAAHIMKYPVVYTEITSLYWYWTTYD
jgi:hypothetical protein